MGLFAVIPMEKVVTLQFTTSFIDVLIKKDGRSEYQPFFTKLYQEGNSDHEI